MTPEQADVVRSVADAVQWLNLGVSVAVLLALLRALARRPRQWRLLVLPLSYAAASTAFYVAALMDLLPGPWASLFSATLRLYSHILAIVVGGVVALAAASDDDGVGDE